jgi:hypothetical protein
VRFGIVCKRAGLPGANAACGIVVAPLFGLSSGEAVQLRSILNVAVTHRRYVRISSDATTRTS